MRQLVERQWTARMVIMDHYGGRNVVYSKDSEMMMDCIWTGLIVEKERRIGRPLWWGRGGALVPCVECDSVGTGRRF